MLHPQSVVGTGVCPCREREVAGVDLSLGDQGRYERPRLVPRVGGEWLLYAPILDG